MPYDEDLANRLRELLADEDAITEKKMFGGLAFLLHGHMSVSASGQGGPNPPPRNGSTPNVKPGDAVAPATEGDRDSAGHKKKKASRKNQRLPFLIFGWAISG